MQEWFAARYSFEALWSAWGAVVIGYAGFMLFERLLPANRNPNAREFAVNIRANLIFFLLNPLVVFAGAWLAAIAASRLGGPQFHINLVPFGSSAINSFILAF